MEAKTPRENIDSRPSGPAVESESSITRWIIAVFAVALLLLGGYRGYQWWAEEAARQAAAAVQPADTGVQSVQEAQPADLSLSGLGSGAGAGGRPDGEAPVTRIGEPVAPAVLGGSVQKCLINGQVTYTNERCPEGTDMLAVQSTAIDPNGVTGSTGERAPVAAIRPALPAEASRSQRAAQCRYLTAEIARLDHEFQYPLPPPVLDQISSDLNELRGQGAALQCPDLPNAPPPSKSVARTEE